MVVKALNWILCSAFVPVEPSAGTLRHLHTEQCLVNRRLFTPQEFSGIEHRIHLYMSKRQIDVGNLGVLRGLKQRCVFHKNLLGEIGFISEISSEETVSELT